MTSHTVVTIEIVVAVCVVVGILTFIVRRVCAALAAVKVEGDRY